eukprot:NP_001021379.1 Uncharacterized protein CELE_AC8.10 [Caenorhabditis elegans]
MKPRTKWCWQEVDQIAVKQLRELKSKRTLNVKLNGEEHPNVPYDFHVWTKSEKDENGKTKRTQPLMKPVSVFGEQMHTIHCVELENGTVKKQCLRFREYVYVNYFSISDTYEVPECNEDVYRPLNSQVAVKKFLKEEAIPHRTLEGVRQVMEERGHHISTKQIQNAARSVRDAVVGNTGPHLSTTEDMLKALQSQNPDRVKYWIDAKQQLHFNIFTLFPDALKLFVHGCPTVTQHERWQRKVERWSLLDKQERKKKISEVLKKHPDGMIFASRIMVDTTFQLGDFYVTFVNGECPRFRTARSLKARMLPLGFFIHTTKERPNHKEFAELLRSELNLVQVAGEPRKIPCVVIDGEAALGEYAKAVDSPCVRCDRHILTLISHNCGQNASRGAQALLFGKKVGGTFRAGLLGSFSMEEFEEKLKKCEKRMAAPVFEWTKAN